MLVRYHSTLVMRKENCVVNPPLHRGDGESIAPPLIVRKNMAKKKDVTIDSMVKVKPITDNQKLVFNEYKNGQNLFLHGAAGTGKTFVSLYLALQEVLDSSSPYECVYLVRSAVPTREIGFVCQVMKKIRLRCSKYRTRIWCSSCLNKHPIVRSVCCMTD